jgi:hypothetical protein
MPQIQPVGVWPTASALKLIVSAMALDATHQTATHRTDRIIGSCRLHDSAFSLH